MATFGATLRKLRDKAGLTRREVEDRTGVSQRHQAYLEDDEREPGMDVLDALVAEFGAELLAAALHRSKHLVGSGSAPKRRNKPDERSVQERSEEPSAAVSAPAWAA